MEKLAKRKDYYNQCRQRQRCSNNGRRKIHQRSQPPAFQTQLQEVTRRPNATTQ